MQALRVQSRTEEGRAGIDLDDFLANQFTPTSADAVAILANFLSADENSQVLQRLTQPQTRLLQGIVSRLTLADTLPDLFMALCVCLSNAWMQGKSHRDALRQAGLPTALVSLCTHEKYGPIVMRGLLAKHEEEEEQDITVYSPNEVDILLTLARESELGRQIIFASMSVTASATPDQVRNGIAKLCQAHFDAAFLLQVVKQWPNQGAILVESLLPEPLRSVAESEEIIATLLQRNNNALEPLLLKLEAHQFPTLWLQVVNDMSREMSREANQQRAAAAVVDQAKILPFATRRVLALNCLSLYLAKGGERFTKPLVRAASPSLAQLCEDYYAYDYEATRAAALVLKHTSLADAEEFAQSVPNLVHLVSVLVRSQDHHTSFIFAGILRTVATRLSNKQFLALDKESILALLSLDLTKLHPHARVELARGMAQLMLVREPATPLQTAQAVKFVSFLLASPSPELQLEAILGLAALPERLLRALPEFEIEILPGTQLLHRLREIVQESAECTDSLVKIQVGAEGEKLLGQIF